MKTVASIIAVLLFVLSGTIASVHGEEEKSEPANPIIISDEPRAIDCTSDLPDYLTQKVTVEIKDWTLLKFSQWLGKTMEMPVILDKTDLDDSGFSEEEPVSGHAKNEPLYLLLRRVLAKMPEPMTYHIEDDVLYIITEWRANETDVTEFINVSSFLDAGYTAKDLVDLVQSQLAGPWFDIDGVGGTIDVYGDIMIVKIPHPIQLEIKAILKALNKPARQTFLRLEGDIALLDKLEDKYTVDFVDVTLDQFVAALAEQTKLPIRLDRIAMVDDRFPTEKPITLKLKNAKLRVILEVIDPDWVLSATVKYGQIVLTTMTVAEELVTTALYDVRDLCRNDDEVAGLKELIQSHTAGPWFDIDGVGGTIDFPKNGVMVVRQTMVAHREVLNLLTRYRKEASTRRLKKGPEEYFTHYYKMRTELAKSLIVLIPQLVEPDSWAKGKGEIHIGRSDPKSTSEKTTDPPAKNEEKPKAEPQDDTSQSVLIIKQTDEIHLEINRIISRVKKGDGFYPHKKTFGPGIGFSLLSLPAE